MRKKLLIVFLLIVCLLAGCGNKQVTAEIQKTIDQNDEQVLVALGDNFEAKKALIQSSELHADGLLALCINPEPMHLDNQTIQELFKEAIERTELTAKEKLQIVKLSNAVYNRALLMSKNLTANVLIAICEKPAMNVDNAQKLFKEAIERTNLTAEQEVQIVKLGNAVYNRAVLMKENLTGDGLVAVCENPVINIDNNRKAFGEIIKRTNLTAKQEVKIAKIGKNVYNRALLMRKNLTAGGLIAVCENPAMNTDNTATLQLFKKAMERTDLTAEQEVQIAKIGKGIYTQILVLKNDLSADGLVAICENPGNIRLEDTVVQEWFREAVKRTELNEEQKVKIAKSKVKGLGLF